MTPNRSCRILARLRGEAGPLKRESVLAWAEANRRLTQGVSAIEGPFRALPYQRFLLEAIGDRRYSEHNWVLAAQTCKTESLNCVIGYFMAQEPAGIMVVYPTLDRAKDYSKKKLARMISSTPVLRKRVIAARSRDSGNTILSKEFPGGDIIIAGSNSPATLRSSSRRVVIQDEIDSYEASAGSEGDPCVLADTRAENFPNAVFIKASTPTVKGWSRIENKFENSTKHRYHVACPKCGHRQWLKWAQLKWPQGQPEAAWYECEAESCKAQWTDSDRIRAIHEAAGDGWIAEHPERRSLGAHLSGLYRLMGLKDSYSSYLHEFAATFLERKRAGKMALKAWMNVFLAEVSEEESESIRPAALSTRAEHFTPTTLPTGVLVVVASADIQKNRIEVEARGFGAEEEMWGIQKEVIFGSPEKDEVWAKLDSFLLQTFRRVDGLELKVERCFIDMAYAQYQLRVLNFCRPRIGRGVYPCLGVNKVGNLIPPLLPKKPSTNNKAQIPHWPVGVSLAKATIYERLMLPVPGARCMHFPHGYGYDDDHFLQLTSEVRRTRYSHGQPYFIFEKINDSIRNEALDLAVYALGALYSFGPINWEKLGKNRLAQLPAAMEQAPDLPAEHRDPFQPPTPDQGQTMQPDHKSVLDYITNSGGAPTIEHFDEDHAPIGPKLREDMKAARLIWEHAGTVRVCAAGGEATARPVRRFRTQRSWMNGGSAY